jgi:D-aspartate ligase
MASTISTSAPVNDSPRRAERGWPPVVIASAHHTAALLMRDLARRGVNVSCFDWDRTLPGFRTRYGRAYACPNPDDQPADWLRFMVDLARGFEQKPVLIPSADIYVSAIAAHARELENHFVFCSNAIDMQAMLATKATLYELAARHGMATPRTEYVITEAEAARFAATANYPCLLKPLHCREWERPMGDGHPLQWQKLVTADTPEVLLNNYRLAAEINPRVVLQEMIVGPDTAKVVYLSCYSRGGERIASCVFRELRTGPINFGCASVVEPVTDSETDTLCDQFLRSLNYSGLCEIELKRDSRDGRLLMIEANPRYSGTSDAAHYDGVDLGWIHYLDLIGRRLDYVGPNRGDFRHICLFRDLSAVNSYRRAGLETWGSILRSYRPPLAFYDLDLRDWRMNVRTAIDVARMLLYPLYRRIVPRRRPQT